MLTPTKTGESSQADKAGLWAASLAVSLYKINILGDKFRHVEFTLERWNRCSSQTRAKLVFKSFHCHQQRDRLRPACVHINYSKYFPVSAEHSFLQSLSQQLGNTHIYLQTMKGILQIPKGIKYNFFLQEKLKKLTAFAQFGCWLLRTEASMK